MPDAVAGVVQAALSDSGAMTTMAVPNMLEVVPTGTHKWVGMDSLLEAMDLRASQVAMSSTCICSSTNCHAEKWK